MRTVLKRFVVFVCVIVCLLAIAPLFCVYAQGEGDVLVPNAGFEEGISTANNRVVIQNWNLTITSSLFFSIDNNSYSGKGLRLRRDCTLTTLDDFKINSGDYSAGFYFKSEATSGTATVRIKLYDQNDKETRIENAITLSQFDWRAVTVEFSVTDQIKSAKLEISVSGAGDSYYYIDQAFVSKKEDVVFPELTTMTGASLRLVEDSSGIRFHGKVDKEQYEAFSQKFTDASVGMIITLKDHLTTINDFTVENLVNANKDYIEIPAIKWYNEDTAEEDGYYGFYCAVANVLPQNIRRHFVFRTYAKCTIGQTVHYAYGNYDEENNSRSVYDIACKIYENIDDYDEKQQTIILDYINSPEQ